MYFLIDKQFEKALLIRLIVEKSLNVFKFDTKISQSKIKHNLNSKILIFDFN